MNGGMSAIAQSRHQLHLKSVRVCASLPSSRALIWNGLTDGNRGASSSSDTYLATGALTARSGQPTSVQSSMAPSNFKAQG
jgi:hypothetical protein